MGSQARRYLADSEGSLLRGVSVVCTRVGERTRDRASSRSGRSIPAISTGKWAWWLEAQRYAWGDGGMRRATRMWRWRYAFGETLTAIRAWRYAQGDSVSTRAIRVGFAYGDMRMKRREIRV
eukprot:3379083-Rhodomonas_salina.4